MPFITEELWHLLPRAPREQSLSLAPFALTSESAADPVSERQFQAAQQLVVAARNAKAEMGLQREKPAAQVASDDLRLLELFRANQENLQRLAALRGLSFTRGRLSGQGIVAAGAGVDLRLLHEQTADDGRERARLEKEKEKLERQIAQVRSQLDNRDFMSRAPREVVRSTQHRHAELSDHYRQVLESLDRLS
jgi:valyl-tRNA synthetase